MTLLFEAICNATPSPSPEESTADQHEGLPSGLSARAVDDLVGRSQPGHTYSNRKAADHSTTSDVYRSHANSPYRKSKEKGSASDRPNQHANTDVTGRARPRRLDCALSWGLSKLDLPVEQPTVFDLAINRKTSKELAVIIPSVPAQTSNRTT
ncbi:hypothetical protein [Bradyrhizobium elkanii]